MSPPMCADRHKNQHKTLCTEKAFLSSHKECNLKAKIDGNSLDECEPYIAMS